MITNTQINKMLELLENKRYQEVKDILITEQVWAQNGSIEANRRKEALKYLKQIPKITKHPALQGVWYVGPDKKYQCLCNSFTGIMLRHHIVGLKEIEFSDPAYHFNLEGIFNNLYKQLQEHITQFAFHFSQSDLKKLIVQWRIDGKPDKYCCITVHTVDGTNIYYDAEQLLAILKLLDIEYATLRHAGHNFSTAYIDCSRGKAIIAPVRKANS